MHPFKKHFVAALIGVAGFGAVVGDLYACGGGRSGGGGHYRARPVIYAQPSYPRQQFPLQSNPQFAHVAQQPGFGNQTGQLPPAVRRLNGNGQQQVGFQQNVQASALQALGGNPVQNSSQLPAQQRVQQAPVTQQQQAPVAQQQQPAQDPMSAAQQSALQALGGMESEVATGNGAAAPAEEAAQPMSAPQAAETGGHVGQWKATLGNGATVMLTLQADGAFSWVASSGGKTSSFQGSYSLEGGALTLVRSSDNQKLAGSLTGTTGGMNFKLNGAKDAGLDFTRG